MADDSMTLSQLVEGGIPSFKDIIPDLLQLGIETKEAQDEFTSLTGSAALAKQTLSELASLASRSPYGREQIMDAAKQLIQFGVEADDVAMRLHDIGNVATGIGKPLDVMAGMFGEIRVKGKAMTSDLDSLAKNGVPIYEALGNMLGFTTDEVKAFADEGNITYNTIKQAFSEMGNDGGQFAGAMGEQTETVDGHFTMLSNRVLDFGSVLGGIMFQAFEPIMALANIIGNILLPVTEALKPAVDGIGKVLAAFVTVVIGATVATKAYNAITFLLTRGQQLLRISSLYLTVATQGLNRAFAANPVGFIIAAFMGLVTVLALAWEQSETFRGIVLGVWEVLKTGWDFVVRLVKVFWDWGLIFVAIRLYIKAFGQIFEWLWPIVQNVFSKIKNWIMDTFGAAINWITDGVKSLFGWLLKIADQLGFTDAVKKIRDAFKTGFEKGKDKESTPNPAQKESEDVVTPGKDVVEKPEADQADKQTTLSAIGRQTQGTQDITQSGLVGVKSDPQAPRSLVINIDRFVESFTLSTTNLTEGASDVRRVLFETFAEAVRDFELSYDK